MNQFSKIKDACSFFTMHACFEAYTKFNELFATLQCFIYPFANIPHFYINDLVSLNLNDLNFTYIFISSWLLYIHIVLFMEIEKFEGKSFILFTEIIFTNLYIFIYYILLYLKIIKIYINIIYIYIYFYNFYKDIENN